MFPCSPLTVSHLPVSLLPHLSTSAVQMSSHLASQPSSCNHGCWAHFKITSRDSWKDIEWLRRVFTSSTWRSRERWYGIKMEEILVTGTECKPRCFDDGKMLKPNFSSDHVTHKGSWWAHCQPLFLLASRNIVSKLSMAAFIRRNCRRCRQMIDDSKGIARTSFSYHLQNYLI